MSCKSEEKTNIVIAATKCSGAAMKVLFFNARTLTCYKDAPAKNEYTLLRTIPDNGDSFLVPHLGL